MNVTALKADLKLIIREPVLVLFMFIPIFIIGIFKLAVIFLLPLLHELTGVNFSSYNGYILSAVFLMTPGILGTVAGFLMIDERDNRIYELMSVTPAGYSGYITNRLFLPFAAGIIYTFAGYFILNIYALNIFILLYTALLVGLEGVLVGLLLFRLAEDKVKGLTYSKAMGGFVALAFADLLNIGWVSILAAICPFYWISRLVINSAGILTVLLSAVIHAVWLGVILKLCKRI